MKQISFVAALAMTASLNAAGAQDAIDTTIFPAAGKDDVQHIFTLPEQDDEQRFKIEIVASKVMEADCNRVMIRADLESEDLEGWGYPYFEIKDVSPPATTMMGCPDGKKTEKPVELLLGDDALIRYNSKLPLVVYAPDDLTVSYRIWSTDGELHDPTR